MIRMIGLLASLSALGLAAPGQISIEPDSRLWVEGGSTVRDWTCTAGEVGGAVVPVAGSRGLAVSTLDGAVASVELRIPVAQLGCGNGTMDSHMKKALKAAEHETILFRLTTYSASAAADGTGALQLKGTLNLAGVDQPVVIQAQAVQDADGTLRIRGSHPITMSQWGVKPPSLMLGTMKVRDEVVVHFDIGLRQQ